MASARSDTELLYFTDPMCSWCWGFSPVIAQVAERYADRAPVRVIVGGLAPGTTDELSDETKREIRGHWDHVHEASGQPFDFSFFDREGFIYDTEPSCRAVACARVLDAAAGLPMLARVHRAFYAEGADVTDADVLADLAADIGVDRARFATMFSSDEGRDATQRDFVLSRQLGINGYPTLVARRGSGLDAITMGFRPLEPVVAAIDTWLGSD